MASSGRWPVVGAVSVRLFSSNRRRAMMAGSSGFPKVQVVRRVFWLGLTGARDERRIVSIYMC